MPSIGHIVLAKEVMKSNETEEVILVDPFSVLTTDVFPFEPKFTVNIGVFSLKRGVTYQIAYFLYSPRGEKIVGKIADIQATKDASEEYGVDFNLSVNIGGVKFTEPGVYSFRFQIANLHEEKSTFFLVKRNEQENHEGEKHE